MSNNNQTHSFESLSKILSTSSPIIKSHKPHIRVLHSGQPSIQIGVAKLVRDGQKYDLTMT
eukprot:5463318-Amphidinium_carterae.1